MEAAMEFSQNYRRVIGAAGRKAYECKDTSTTAVHVLWAIISKKMICINKFNVDELLRSTHEVKSRLRLARNEVPPLSRGFKETVKRSIILAKADKVDYVTLKHLIKALLKDRIDGISTVLKRFDLDQEDFQSNIE